MAIKKTTSKKAPTKKKSTVKRASAKTRSTAVLGPIRIQPETQEFMTFRLTKETVYWLVLGAVVILFTIWLMRLQMDIQALYDDVDASNLSSQL
jgi:hypothetical protein